MEKFFESYKQIIDNHIAQIRQLLANGTIRQLGWEYNLQKNSQPEKPLNVFTMASDLYYRENFHSDIIKVFLDPSENHQEGTTFLYAFIDFLNDNFGNKVSIRKMDYRKVIVEREFRRIDILIRSEESRHCIIIENKIYNAGDTKRQLPKYYDFMTDLGYSIDAIVYLPLDINKQPDMSTWKGNDKQHVLPLLCHVPAYQKKGISLVNGWLLPCTQLTKNLDCISILRQYSELIKLLSNNIMDNIILGKFYNSLLEGDNLQTAKSVRNMLNDIPAYMKDRIMEQLRNKGYNNVWTWKPSHCGIIFRKDGNEYKIDVWTSEDGYSVQVFCQGISLNDVPWSEDIAKTLDELGFAINGERYEKADYTFTDETKLLQHVDLLAQQLKSMLE